MVSVGLPFTRLGASPLRRNLAPLRRGFFVRAAPRGVQPTLRFGVEVVGLLNSSRRRQALLASKIVTHLAPPPRRGFFYGRALCNHAAGLSANLLEVGPQPLRWTLLAWQAHPSPRRMPEHELEGWQRGNRLGLRILCELGRRYPGIVQATGPVRRKSA